MFKFDFVQDGNNEQAQNVQDEEGELTEPVLTEISFIELVRAPAIKLTENSCSSCEFDPLRSWTLCPPSFPSRRCRYRLQGTVQESLSLGGTSSTRDFS